MAHEKVWFITGCSTGFGRAIAEAVIKVGYKVVATARNRDSITELTAGNKANALALKLDVTKPEQIKQAVSDALGKFGRIDVLVIMRVSGISVPLKKVSKKKHAECLKLTSRVLCMLPMLSCQE